MSVVAFTGTREPPDDWRPLITNLVAALPAGTVVVTGACRGVDALVARLASQRRLWVHTVVPGERGPWLDEDWARWCTSSEAMPPRSTFRQRDERVVGLALQFGGQVVAVPRWPAEDPRSQRSGTWLTVRIAQRLGVEVYVARFWTAAAALELLPDAPARRLA